MSLAAANYHQLHPKQAVDREMAASLRYFHKKHHGAIDALLFVQWFFRKIDLAAANDLVIAWQQRPDDPALHSTRALVVDSVRGLLQL